MTGTGTKADPYIPTNINEFREAVAELGAYVSCPENAVWDMNEQMPEGFTQDIDQIVIDCAEIKGNGLTIKNLFIWNALDHPFIISTDYDNYKTIEDLNIINVYNSYPVTLISMTEKVFFKRCKFSIYSNYSNPIFSFVNGFIHFLDCSFYVKNIAASATIFRGNMDLICCNIYFEDKKDYSSLCGFFDSLNLMNCKITGEMHEPGSINGSSSGTIFDCIFNSNPFAPSSTSNIILYNSDKGTANSQDWIGVTTLQLKNKAYLQSLDFPIR